RPLRAGTPHWRRRTASRCAELAIGVDDLVPFDLSAELGQDRIALGGGKRAELRGRELVGRHLDLALAGAGEAAVASPFRVVAGDEEVIGAKAANKSGGVHRGGSSGAASPRPVMNMCCRSRILSTGRMRIVHG